MKPKLYFLFLVISLTVFFSCSSKKEAKELFSFYDETEKLYKNSEKNCLNQIYKLEKLVANGGNKPKDTIILYHTKLVNAKFLEVQNEIDDWKDSIFYKELDKDYNFDAFDTLLLMTKLPSGKNKIVAIETKLQKIISDFGFEELEKLFVERKRKFYFLEFHDSKIIVKRPDMQSKAGIILLELSSLSLEINELRWLILKKQSEIADSRIYFKELRPVVRVKTNVVNEGEEYNAQLFFVARGHVSNGLLINVNGLSIPVKNDEGEVKFIAIPGKYNSIGLSKKSWKGDILCNFKGIDSTFKVVDEYYVKRKCDAKE